MAYYSPNPNKGYYLPRSGAFGSSKAPGRRTSKTASTGIIKAPRYIPVNGWNQQFQNVFNFVENGTGNGCINATAGSGKTTALVESIIRYSEKNPTHKVLFIAFNVSIKEEGEKRLAGYNNVDVLTCHGLGFRAVRRPSAWGGPKGNQQFDVQDCYGSYMQSLAENEIGPEPEKADDREAIMGLVSKAKMTLTNDIPGMLELIDKFDIESSYSKDELIKQALKIMEFTKKRPGTSISQGRGKGEGRVFSKAAITFDDEIWLPIVNDWRVDQYDAVFVDECQDLSKARRELVARSLKDNARLFIVGDVNQAIYTWAGADITALPEMVEEFSCESLYLTCSWRCAESIIREARQFNPIITARPNAPEGIVDRCKYEELIEKLEYGDVLLSRTNAPLVRLFFQLAKIKKNVKLLGKDYGRMLAGRIKSWKRKHEEAVLNGDRCELFTATILLEYNDAWLNYCLENKKEYKVAKDRLRDEYETMISLVDGIESDMDSTESVQEVLNRCGMFSPDDVKKENGNWITLSSIHKYKGAEAKHVYVLTDTCNPGSNQEETNITYTAITRAKNHLTYVVGKYGKKKEK